MKINPLPSKSANAFFHWMLLAQNQEDFAC